MKRGVRIVTIASIARPLEAEYQLIRVMSKRRKDETYRASIPTYSNIHVIINPAAPKRRLYGTRKNCESRVYATALLISAPFLGSDTKVEMRGRTGEEEVHDKRNNESERDEVRELHLGLEVRGHITPHVARQLFVQ
jgi:hypothetical protein